MPRSRIVVARAPKRNRPKKVQPAAVALTESRIVSARKPGLKRYMLPEAAEDAEADARFRLGTAEMPARKVWRCYGDDPRPSREEARASPIWAFRS